jgi:D-alanine-D-alanine ligase
MPRIPGEDPPKTCLTFRAEVTDEDRDAIRRIVAGTGFFRPDEIEVAVELVDSRLEKGDASGYFFLLAELNGHPVGYACFGPIACTIGSFDLYWIAIDPDQQGQGVGRMLLAEVERRIWEMEGRHIYIETSGRPLYEPTRGFYQRCGYEIAATLADFYDLGDDKVIWRKRREAAKAASET